MAVFPVNIDWLTDRYKQICLIDLSWVLHRSMHVFRNFSVSPIEGTDIPTGHFYGTLLVIQSFLNYEGMAVVIVRDGHPVERIEQSKDAGVAYKADRPELEYDFYKDVPKLVNLSLACSDVYYAYNPDKESDDVMYCMARKIDALNKGTQVWIHSGDNDLLQSITKSGSIKVARSFDKGQIVPIGFDEVVNLEQFTKKFNGVGPDKIVLYRSVVGDSSDNIKGVPRFPRDLLKEMVTRANSVDDLFKFESAKYAKQINKLREHESQVRANYRLMKLQDNFEPNLVGGDIPSDWWARQTAYYRLTRWENFLRRRKDFHMGG